MKRFKVLALFFMIFVMLFVLTACDKKSEKITLTVWESTLGPDEFIKQAGEAYTKKNPNVEIKYVNVELGDSSGQIALDGPAGIGPDLFAAPHDKLGELINGGHILETVDADKVREMVLSSTASALTYNGKMYGYPVSAETYALFYNKDLIAEKDIPKTWSELKEFAKNFDKPGKHPFLMDVGNGYYTIIFTTGGGTNLLFGPDGTDVENTNINNEIAVEGMRVFQGLREVIDVPAADLTTAYCDGAFAAGNVALYITGPWNIKNFTDSGINFGVKPLPAMTEGGDPVASFSGTRAMFVSAYSKHPEEAADFAKFLLTEEMQRLRFELTGGALPSIDVEVDSPYAEGFLTQLEYAFPMPSIPAMGGFWDSMNAASANIWDGADIQAELNAVDAAIKAAAK